MARIEKNAFCDKLRQYAVELAEGKHPQGVAVTYQMIVELFDMDFSKADKINPSYIRSIMSRVPELKAAGRLSIKPCVHDEYGKYFAITVDTSVKRRVISGDEIDQVKAKAVAKFANKIVGCMPNVMHLEGEAREGALEGIRLYQNMIREMMEGE
jgi:hypothetical protein|nr:MAG TPA: hypothetical protein [Caudoviricetes sp.]